MSVAYLKGELRERAGDFIAASSVGRLEEMEGTVAASSVRIQELEQQVADRDVEITQSQVRFNSALLYVFHVLACI